MNNHIYKDIIVNFKFNFISDSFKFSSEKNNELFEYIMYT